VGTKSIRSLRANVTREEALRTFTASGPVSFLWKLRSGPLQRIAEAYLPFRLYRVGYHRGQLAQAHMFALDAVDGSLDLFEFGARPGDQETVMVSTRNHAAPLLPAMQAEQIVRLEIERLPDEIHLPYWIGFYGTRENLRCRVMDAVRRRIEGARASALFEHWLGA
jgi:hypothetical protein